MGIVSVLNVGHGDTKLTFDPEKPEETKRAAAAVEDMLKRGFAILVEVGEDKDGEPLYRRAKAFDPKTNEYIIVGAPEEPASPAPKANAPANGRRRKKATKTPTRRVPAVGTKSVAVGRTAGG